MSAYSNLSDQVEQLRSLLGLPRVGEDRSASAPVEAGPEPPWWRRDCAAGRRTPGRCGVKELAVEFGVHRDTVHDILVREGALRRRGILPDAVPEVIRLYGEGWSMARLGAKLGVSPSTVNNALRKAGVAVGSYGSD